MYLSKYSNLDLLRKVYVNLYPSKDITTSNGLSEKELAALIHTFYQESVVATVGEKRKIEHEESGNKKPRVLDKVFIDILSALELLPNEVFEMILKHLCGKDKKNLRSTSIELYDKTTLMAPMFHAWGFATIRGPQPDFVLKNDKNFCVSDLEDDYEVGPTLNLVTIYPHRISSIEIDVKGVLFKYLKLYPATFTNLTSLELRSVYFSNDSLLVLVPQLENLTLANMKNVFDLSESTIHQAKLKTLKLIETDMFDAKEILMKCCKTVECLEFDPVNQSYGLDDIEEELSCLNNLFINIEEGSEGSARNLISKCSGSLRTMTVMVNEREIPINLCTLFNETMKITTLVIEPTLETDVERLLSKCPLIQNLRILFHNSELKEVCLNDLKELKLVHCGDVCMTSAVNNIFKSSKASVKILHLEIEENYEDEIEIECEFNEIPEMDTVWCSRMDMGSEELGKIRNLFPRKSEVIRTEEPNGTVFRRVYNLQ